MKRRTRGKSEGTNEVDALVGQRLRELRMLAGLSQSDLAATIGLTFQQLQKYERGVNRISASKLYLLACHLNVPVATFFADLDGQQAGEPAVSSETAADPDGEVASTGEAPIRSREALVLARHFQRIRNPAAKAALKAFVETCAGIPFAEGVASESTARDPGAILEHPAGPGESRRKKHRRPRGVVWHPTDISKT